MTPIQMRGRVAWLLPLAMLLCSFASLAQVGPTSDKDAGDCDRYASIDDIPSRGIKKADYGFIDVDLALPPCSAAYASNPKNSRVQAQLARIYFQQGKFEQGIELARASVMDQAISLSILGEASRRGVGGVSINPREAARYFQEGVDRGSADSMNALAERRELPAWRSWELLAGSSELDEVGKGRRPAGYFELLMNEEASVFYGENGLLVIECCFTF